VCLSATTALLILTYRERGLNENTKGLIRQYFPKEVASKRLQEEDCEESKRGSMKIRVGKQPQLDATTKRLHP
jgi:hypothetical protein